jgi:hypothetical protein
MDPSIRWDDGDVADAVSAWIPAFAGMTLMRWNGIARMTAGGVAASRLKPAAFPGMVRASVRQRICP